MDDVALGGMLEGISHLDRHVDRAGQVERSRFRHDVAEIHPLDEFEDDEMPPVFRTDGMHPADVLVIETGCRLGLVLEPPQHLLITRLVPRKHLDSDDAVERRVERPEHGPHAAATDKLFQLVGTEPRSLEQPPDFRHRRRSAGRPLRDHGRIEANRRRLFGQAGVPPVRTGGCSRI